MQPIIPITSKHMMFMMVILILVLQVEYVQQHILQWKSSRLAVNMFILQVYVFFFFKHSIKCASQGPLSNSRIYQDFVLCHFFLTLPNVMLLSDDMFP